MDGTSFPHFAYSHSAVIRKETELYQARREGHEIQRERKAQCNMSDSYSKPRYDAFPGELTLEEGISATWGGQRGINQSSA